MSTQAQHIPGQNPWDHQQQFGFKQPLQLEEHPHSFEVTARRFPPQHPLNRYSTSPSVSFATSSAFIRQSTFDPDALQDPSPSSFGAYSQPGLNSLDPTHANYPTSPFNGAVNHTPEGSPNPNLAVANQSPSHSYRFAPGPMQFSPPLPLPVRPTELQSRYFPSYSLPQDPSQKRARQVDDSDDNQGEQLDAQEQEARPKHSGACSRCKSLKVRCEFRNDSDTCKRCTSAGQECVIPGRKPRRVPPKREHLLNQIREQAKQIQELMAKVETLSQPSTFQSPRSPASSLHSPMEPNAESVVPNAEMQDWISKARVSIQEFGGLIPARDPVDTDEPYLSDDGVVEDYSDDESGYATAEDDPGSPASATNRKQVTHTTLKLLPGEDAPYGLMAALAIRRNARERSVEPESSEAVGVASADFFRPSPGPDPMRLQPSNTGIQLPHILARGIVSTKEVDKLFTIYFQKMNISTSLLDPVLHTPQYVAMRSPFLFTIMCGVASRFYEPRPHLYQQLIQYGQLAAGTALISGTKNEEMSAAYLLMQLYPVPAKRWDEERSWIYLGVAVRVAQDINLNRPITTKPLNEQNARILLSRQRIWMNCFNLDRSTGTQYGKRPIIPHTDYFAVHSEDWWRSSPHNMKGFDIHLCGYNAELRLISNFSSRIYGDPNHPTGLDKSLNVAQLASDTDDLLRQLGEHWFKRLDEFEEEKTEMCEFRSELLRMAIAYSRLVALSAGLKHAKGQLGENTFIMRCLDAASDIVNAFVRRLFPTPERKSYLRHAPDAQFVFVTFAGAFLVKLLQPKYSQFFTNERRQEIRTLVQEAVDLLGAPEVVVDDKHGPKLFSRFLGGLLATQSVNPNTLSPNSGKGNNMRRTSSRKGKDTNGSSASSPINSYLPGTELSSPSMTSDSSPAQHFNHFDSHSRGQSPLISDALGLSAADFNPPMPVDQELLDSMQLFDPVWQDTTVPGFNWMSQLNVGGSALNIHTNDYALYEQHSYPPSY